MDTIQIPHPWMTEDISRLQEVKTFRCIARIALEVLGRFESHAVMLSGPMTTGGKGSIEENFKTYRKGLAFLKHHKLPVFNQLPAESEFRRLWLDWYNQGNRGYCWPILDDFYEPIFASGKIKSIHFIPDWQSSTGCNRERELALRFSLEIIDLPLNWETEFEINT